MEQKIINKILIRLKDTLDELYDDFIEEMRFENMVISGTFILQAYYDEIWKDSDIDIFIMVPEEMYEKNYNYEQHKKMCCDKNHYYFTENDLDNGMMFHNIKYDDHIYVADNYKQQHDERMKTKNLNPKNTHTYITRTESILFKNYVSYTYIYPDYYDQDIKLVRNYYHRQSDEKSRIQIIHLKSHPERFIAETFDFPIIKNIFGRHINGDFYLKISSPESIVNRKTMFYVNPLLDKSLARAKKYYNKYNVQFEYPFNDEINSVMEKLICDHKNNIHEAKHFGYDNRDNNYFHDAHSNNYSLHLHLRQMIEPRKLKYDDDIAKKKKESIEKYYTETNMIKYKDFIENIRIDVLKIFNDYDYDYTIYIDNFREKYVLQKPKLLVEYVRPEIISKMPCIENSLSYTYKACHLTGYIGDIKYYELFDEERMHYPINTYDIIEKYTNPNNITISNMKKEYDNDDTINEIISQIRKIEIKELII